jgi:hypothetical protein
VKQLGEAFSLGSPTFSTIDGAGRDGGAAVLEGARFAVLVGIPAPTNWVHFFMLGMVMGPPSPRGTISFPRFS